MALAGSDRWRLLIDPPAAGARNMACDEALLDSLASGAGRPALRLYEWAPACLSIGALQPGAQVSWDQCARQNVEVVRRPTGGGAVLHVPGYELTYAVVAPAGHPLVSGDIRTSYRKISAVLRAGLELLGLQLDEPVPSKATRSAACFAASAAYELTAGGRKLAGSAQLRRGGALLQQGSILIKSHAELLAPLLCDRPDLAGRATSLAELLQRPVTQREVAQSLLDAFEQAGARFASRNDWSDGETRRIAELEIKHRSKGWVRDRQWPAPCG